MKPTLRPEDQADSDAGFRTETANLLAAFGKEDANKIDAWFEDLLALDCISDGTHHFEGWKASAYAPVFRFQMSWGGPGDQWELACIRTKHRWALQRAAYVFLPWFAYDAHHIRQGSRTWKALEALLEYSSVEHDSPYLDEYDDQE